MKCPNCGNDVLSTDSHCGSCGVHLATAFKEKSANKPASNSHLGVEAPSSASLKSTGRVCPRCGYPVKSTDITCGHCTHYLGPIGSIPSSTCKTSDNIYAVLAILFTLFVSPIPGIILGCLGVGKSINLQGKGMKTSIVAIIISIASLIILFTVVGSTLQEYINILKIYLR